MEITSNSCVLLNLFATGSPGIREWYRFGGHVKKNDKEDEPSVWFATKRLIHKQPVDENQRTEQLCVPAEKSSRSARVSATGRHSYHGLHLLRVVSGEAERSRHFRPDPRKLKGERAERSSLPVPLIAGSSVSRLADKSATVLPGPRLKRHGNGIHQCLRHT